MSGQFRPLAGAPMMPPAVRPAQQQLPPSLPAALGGGQAGTTGLGLLRSARSPPPPHLQLDGGWPGPCSPPRSAPPRSHSFPPPPLDGRAARLVPPRFSRHEPGKGDEPGKKPLAAIGAPLRFRPCFPTPPHAPSQPERPPSFIRAPGGSGGHPGRGGTAGGAASERAISLPARGRRRRTRLVCAWLPWLPPPDPQLLRPLRAPRPSEPSAWPPGRRSHRLGAKRPTGKAQLGVSERGPDRRRPFPRLEEGRASERASPPAGPAPPAPAAERLLQSPTAGKQPASHQSHCLLAGWKDAAGGAS